MYSITICPIFQNPTCIALGVPEGQGKVVWRLLFVMRVKHPFCDPLNVSQKPSWRLSLTILGTTHLPCPILSLRKPHPKNKRSEYRTVPKRSARKIQTTVREGFLARRPKREENSNLHHKIESYGAAHTKRKPSPERCHFAFVHATDPAEE